MLSLDYKNILMAAALTLAADNIQVNLSPNPRSSGAPGLPGRVLRWLSPR
jgi:hypothetical protein